MKRILIIILLITSYTSFSQVRKVYSDADFMLGQGFAEVQQGVVYKAGQIVLNTQPTAGNLFGWRVKNNGRYTPNVWANGVSYTPFRTVRNAGNVYINQGGTGTSSIAPTHTSGDVSDGVLIWTYLSPYSDVEPVFSYTTPMAVEDGTPTLDLNTETRPLLTQYNSPTNWLNKPGAGYYMINTVRNANSPNAQAFQTAAGVAPYNGFFYRSLSVSGWSEWLRFFSTGDTAVVTGPATIGQVQHRIDSAYAASAFTIGNADGTGDTVMVATSNSATFKRIKSGSNISISSDATSMTISAGGGTVKILPNADYTITTSDHTLILTEVAANRTITLPAASTMPNKEINLSVRATTVGRWLLSGSFVQKSTVGANPISENFVNSGLPNGINYRLVSDGVKWYDINN